MSWGSRTALVREFFGEGDFDFRLTVGQLVELQDVTQAGPAFLMQRIEAGASATWLSDVKHTLRLGLLGGGMEREAAHRLVERHVQAGYLLRCATVAVKVLAAAYVGVDEERDLGERKGSRPRRSRSPKAGSDLAKSTEPPAPQA